MKLWKRAAGALKDQSSILRTKLIHRKTYRNPSLESSIIKATSHDETSVDYRNAQRVFAWIRTSPVSLKPLIWALTSRMERTQSWVVTIKGLMLMHGVFCCKTPAVQRIGRLPFDLSNFTDMHSHPNKMWGYNAFVRAYYLFLDRRSTLLYEQRKQTEVPMVQELVKLQNWQSLLNILMQVKPMGYNMNHPLIFEAMDCILIEVFDVYSRICEGIARVLKTICSAGKLEATMTLKILQNATTQIESLEQYFEFCKKFGVLNAMGIPKLTQIPEEDIQELERIINELPGSGRKAVESTSPRAREENCDDFNNKAIVLAAANEEVKGGAMHTIVTDKWEVFDDDHHQFNEDTKQISTHTTSHHHCASVNPFEVPENYLALVHVPLQMQEIPDLISF